MVDIDLKDCNQMAQTNGISWIQQNEENTFFGAYKNNP